MKQHRATGQESLPKTRKRCSIETSWFSLWVHPVQLLEGERSLQQIETEIARRRGIINVPIDRFARCVFGHFSPFKLICFIADREQNWLVWLLRNVAKHVSSDINRLHDCCNVRQANAEKRCRAKKFVRVCSKQTEVVECLSRIVMTEVFYFYNGTVISSHFI